MLERGLAKRPRRFLLLQGERPAFPFGGRGRCGVGVEVLPERIQKPILRDVEAVRIVGDGDHDLGPPRESSGRIVPGPTSISVSAVCLGTLRRLRGLLMVEPVKYLLAYVAWLETVGRAKAGEGAEAVTQTSPRQSFQQ